MIAEHPHQNFTDAMFESMSGLTTTGASVLGGIDYLPHAIKFYRQELQFLGGMGIVVLAVAVLPMLGIGGLQLYRDYVSISKYNLNGDKIILRKYDPTKPNDMIVLR